MKGNTILWIIGGVAIGYLLMPTKMKDQAQQIIPGGGTAPNIIFPPMPQPTNGGFGLGDFIAALGFLDLGRQREPITIPSTGGGGGGGLGAAELDKILAAFTEGLSKGGEGSNLRIPEVNIPEPEWVERLLNIKPPKPELPTGGGEGKGWKPGVTIGPSLTISPNLNISPELTFGKEEKSWVDYITGWQQERMGKPIADWIAKTFFTPKVAEPTEKALSTIARANRPDVKASADTVLVGVPEAPTGPDYYYSDKYTYGEELYGF